MTRRIIEREGKKYRILDGTSSDSLYFFDRGLARLRKGDNYQGAYEDFTSAINLDPNFADAYVNRAITYQCLNKRQEAYDDVAKALELEPLNTAALFNRGYMYGQQEMFQESLTQMDAVLKLDPTHEKAMFYRGIAKVNLDDEAGACEDWKKAVELGFEDIHGIIDEHCKG